MKDEEKSKEQLIIELIELRQQVSQLQKTAMKNESIISKSRKLAEVSLRLSEERFYKVFNSSPLAISIHSFPTDGRILYVNDSFEEFTGFQREECIGRTPKELNLWVNAGDENKITQLFIKQGFIRNIELFSRMKYGEFRIGLFSAEFINFDGEQCILMVITDITELKRAEVSLRLSEERFYKVFNNSPMPMSINSIPDGQFLYVNNSMEKFTGYQREELINSSFYELHIWINPEDGAKIKQLLAEQGFVRNLEYSCRMKSGELRTGLFSAEFINFKNEQCVVTVINDITERKQFEKELLRLDRLDLIGEMAAGIGHEIRNPMTTVRGFLQILGSKEVYVQHKEYFELMIEELDRANSIISEFLSLAKNKSRKYETKNINSIVEVLLPLIQADATKDDIIIKVELGKTKNLFLNEKEIRQLILNLVRNGLEGMSAKGNLILRTFMDNETVVLSIQDQGKGIEPDVLEKLGTPFFTTKEKGTGLGLAVCYSIAERHHAKIEIESDFSGTTILVRFA